MAVLPIHIELNPDWQELQPWKRGPSSGSSLAFPFLASRHHLVVFYDTVTCKIVQTFLYSSFHFICILFAYFLIAESFKLVALKSEISREPPQPSILGLGDKWHFFFPLAHNFYRFCLCLVSRLFLFRACSVSLCHSLACFRSPFTLLWTFIGFPLSAAKKGRATKMVPFLIVITY